MATPKKKETPDDKITQLLELVERQKAAIAEAERPVFRTLRRPPRPLMYRKSQRVMSSHYPT
jgi:hypothetical protein